MTVVPFLLSSMMGIQAPDTLHLTEMQRIAGDGPNYVFDQIVDMAVDPDGAVFIVLPNQQSVTLFDETGQLEQVVGSAGSGPGEFRFPISAGWRADTLWIWDGGLGRFSLWDRAGTFVRSINAAEGSGVALLRDGSVLLAVRETSIAPLDISRR